MASKRLRLAKTSSDPPTSSLMDWSKCCLCQVSTGADDLVCPALHTAKSLLGAGYNTLADNLIEFQKLGSVPLGLDTQNVDEGSGIEETFRRHQAKWHKKCALNFNNTKLDRARAKHKRSSGSSLPSCQLSHDDLNGLSCSGETMSRSSRSTVPIIHMQDEICFICKQKATIRRPLFKVASLQDAKLKKCADVLNNLELKAFLEGGDLVAKEAKYHSKCYTNVINCLRPTSTAKEENVSPACDGMAFASVARFIREKLNSLETGDTEYIFRMSDLASIYRKSLAHLLGIHSTELPSTHSTRIRERVLDHFPELNGQLSGRDYILYRDGANVFQDVHSENVDDDAVAFERFVKRIRKDITQTSVAFDGRLSKDCQVSYVPPALLALVNSVLYGCDSAGNTNRATQPAVTISQLIVFNHNENIPHGTIIRHKRKHEPPFPLYVGLSLYGRTRNRTVVDNMHDMGISVSSNRITEITATLSHLVTERALEEGVLCPSNLRHGLFTVGAYDNIDHNYSSTTGESSFHGTGISMFQIPVEGQTGHPRNFITNFCHVNQRSRTVPQLPDSYGVVKAVTLHTKQPSAPKACELIYDKMLPSVIGLEWKNEREWLDHVLTDRKDGPLDLAWAAFHATKQANCSFDVALTSLLPLFNEDSSSASMLKHAMDHIRKLTNFLNPGQVPVICADQPLYALTKLVQWNWPEVYGESTFVALFAPFHIEQAFLKVLGQILQGSGWVGVITNSGINTEASAEGNLKVTHVTKARAIHQKTASVLYSLLQDSYTADSPEKSFEEWIAEKSSQSPTFRFWFLVLNLEILLLSFVRSVREGKYELFRQSLKNMMPWFFLLDHQNYARWLSVHIKDLEELEQKAPSVHSCFCNGQFVIRKTNSPFSAIAVDQAHEQHNAVIKGDGGAVGLLQDPAMLRRWMLAGPELISILDEFEVPSKSNKRLHHEQYSAFQVKFQEKKQALKDSFLEFGNPFRESSSDLIVWDTKVIMDKERVSALVNAEERGLGLYRNFVRERLIQGAKTCLFAPLRKTGTKFFGFVRKKSLSPIIHDLKNDVELFSRLFIVSRNRKLDLDKFFQHENTGTPPCLSSNGVLRACQKSQLTQVLEEMIEAPQFHGSCDAIIYDGAALVHALPPRSSRTFADYCNTEYRNRFFNDVESLNARRIDIAWDTYTTVSLKKQTRKSRGVGVRRKVAEWNSLPKNWHEFLRCDENKEELFMLLGNYALTSLQWTHVVTEVGGTTLSSKPEGTSIDGVHCRQEEEADGRIFLHAKDSVVHGAKKILIFTADTDVVVLAISFFPMLKNAGLEEMWILFGVGKAQRYLCVHAMVESLGLDKANALRGFHSFTGSDTTSSFSMKGKISAWHVWKSFPEVTAAFEAISRPLPSIPDEVFQVLEKYVVLLYYKGGEEYSLNEVRKVLFTSKSRTLNNLPPTSAALEQHCLRAAYQAGQVWGRACSVNDPIPSPNGWGWTIIDREWQPVWSSLPPIWDTCRELVKCGCSTGCQTRCSCRKAQVPCTLLCTNCAQNCCNKSAEAEDEEDDLP